VIGRHCPSPQRNAMFDEMEISGATGPGAMARDFVRPIAGKLSGPHGGKAPIRFAAIMLFHGLADHSRLREMTPGDPGRASMENCVVELDTMMLAALTASTAAARVESPTQAQKGE
jgi:hypothetical protein